MYHGADKSLARPGRKQARKHVRDARDFNNIETQAVIKFFFFPLQGKAPKEIRAILTETLACFLPGRAKDLSAPLLFVANVTGCPVLGTAAVIPRYTSSQCRYLPTDKMHKLVLFFSICGLKFCAFSSSFLPQSDSCSLAYLLSCRRCAERDGVCDRSAQKQQWCQVRSSVWNSFFRRLKAIIAYDSAIMVGRDSSVGIATSYGLECPGIESWLGWHLPHPSEPALGAHPVCCTMGTVSFPEVKRPERGVDHPSPSSAETKESVELYSTPPLGLHGLFWGKVDLHLYFFTCNKVGI